MPTYSNYPKKLPGALIIFLRFYFTWALIEHWEVHGRLFARALNKCWALIGVIYSIFFFYCRSELYGGSNADLSKGANGVKSAESVLRLIGSGNSNGPELLSSSSSKIQKYLSSLPPPQPASTLSKFCC